MKNNGLLYLLIKPCLQRLVIAFALLFCSAAFAYAASESVKSGKTAYSDLYPQFYVIKKNVPVSVSKNTLYLTFDDGPSVRTDEILKILDKKGVKATFFVVGTKDAANLARMREIVRLGHAIGLHSYSHNYRKIYASVPAFLCDLNKEFTLIKQTTGVTPEIYRMPGGSVNRYNRRIYRQIKKEMARRGFVEYDWNMSACDTAPNCRTTKQIVSNIKAQSARIKRPIVLMHDSEKKVLTVQALEEIIDFFIAKGYKFEKLTRFVL